MIVRARGHGRSFVEPFIFIGTVMQRELVMETIIFVPGAGGSRLKLLNQEIWPPDPGEILFTGYHRVSELLDRRVKVTKVLDVYPPGALIPCYEVYSPLQYDLNKIANDQGFNRLDFPYDWRVDIAKSAAKLASKISSSASGSSITLVCHSMGNLVARTLLESGVYSSKPWFSKITKYVGICGPHFGVPEILEYVLGLKDWLGISPADMKSLSADKRYPACYQCLPFKNYPALWDVAGSSPQEKDFYTQAVVTAFQLSRDNIGAAADLHNKLNFVNRPAGVQYVLIAGTGQSTAENVQYSGTTYYDTASDYLGDGTIPTWSSTSLQITSRTTPGDHMGILKSYPFRQILYEILSNGALTPELSLVEMPGLTISLNNFTYAPHEPIEVLIIPDLRTGEISGTLQIARAVDPKGERYIRYQEQPFVYRGPQISFLRSTIPAPADFGAYRITFAGSHGTSQRTAGAFGVSRVSVKRTTKRPTR